MNYLLLLVSALFIGLKSVYAKKGNLYINEVHNIYTYNFYMFLIAFLIMVVTGISTWNGLSYITVIIAVFYGLSLFFSQFFLIKAMNVGGASVSALFYSCGFLVPTFVSVFLYNEVISLLQILGVVLMLISFVVTVEGKEKSSMRWFVFIFAALSCNGLCGVAQKVFRMSEFGYQQSGFMMIAFLVGALVAMVCMPQKNFSLPSKGFLTTVFVSGIALGLVNAINVHIAGLLPGSIIFPCVNGGGIIVSAILARVLLRERLSFRKKVGIIIGLTAICLIAF